MAGRGVFMKPLGWHDGGVRWAGAELWEVLPRRKTQATATDYPSAPKKRSWEQGEVCQVLLPILYPSPILHPAWKEVSSGRAAGLAAFC